MAEQGGKNQGEGDRESDRRYRAGAREFIDEGQVPPAAAAAAQAIEGAEGAELAAAEQEGKRRIAEEERHRQDGPVPSFWTDEQQTGWDRVKDALRRDWLQTKADLGLAGGADLGQTAKQTMKQATGQLPVHSDLDGGGWDVARQAIRLGYGAATYWHEEPEWTEYVEYQVQREWESMNTGVHWQDARPLVQHGWDQGRKDVRPAESERR
jgi:hypothetical protein